MATTRIALSLALAAALPAGPALALEVTPTGHLLSDYTVNLTETLSTGGAFAQTFGVSRARIGLKAKEGPVMGMIQTDASNVGGTLDVHIRHAFADVDTGMGRLRGGQFSTGWAIPVEQDWYPYRLQGVDFSTREDLFPTEDRGVSWAGSTGPLSLNVGVFNGEGYTGDETKVKSNFPKAYETTVRFKAMDNAELGVHARFNDAPAGQQTQGTALLGFKTDMGMLSLGAEGGVNMKQTGTATSSLGIGGSVFAYAPNLIPVPMFETPIVRVDYAGDNFAGTKGNPNAHYRMQAGLLHNWAKGADTMISYEIDNELASGKQVAQIVSWRGGLKF
ncbi:MAG: hypothetical protein FJZ01_18720 [Candidatus Sericytochromatia bacterium]|nr:hypothetical protein [Candidatus Tanganyikabacteria bacterium]